MDYLIKLKLTHIIDGKKKIFYLGIEPTKFPELRGWSNIIFLNEFKEDVIQLKSSDIRVDKTKYLRYCGDFINFKDKSELKFTMYINYCHKNFEKLICVDDCKVHFNYNKGISKISILGDRGYNPLAYVNFFLDKDFLKTCLNIKEFIDINFNFYFRDLYFSEEVLLKLPNLGPKIYKSFNDTLNERKILFERAQRNYNEVLSVKERLSNLPDEFKLLGETL